MRIVSDSIVVCIYNELLAVKLFSCYRIKGLSSLLFCFAFVFCRMSTFNRYIEVHFTFRLLDCARYNEDFVISRLCSIHFTVTLAGLKYIVHYRDPGRSSHCAETTLFYDNVVSK